MDGFRKRVADAFRRHARHLGDSDVHDAALVRIERTELLIDAGLLDLLGQQLRHLAQFDVFALAILERVDEDTLVVGQAAPVGHVDDVLERLEGLTTVAHEDLGLLARDVEPRAVGRLLDVDRRVDPKRRGETVQEFENWLGGVWHIFSSQLSAFSFQFSRAAASVLPPPTRFICRCAGGLTVWIFGGPIR